MRDEDYMRMALQLAEKGCGWVSPNPMVGAVIVKDGRVIGQGYHERYGGPHAERNALASCTESPDGATMYVTLEPCCHVGKQPPCTEAILEAGIQKVVVGSADPNPLVCGKGIRQLREHGVHVVEGVLQEACDRINEAFFHYIRTGRPLVVMKYAMTMDGKIAAYTGDSKWITGEEARKHVHQQRHQAGAILVGIGTVLADDPLLTCRIPGGKNPIRIVCDSKLRTPVTAQVVTTARQTPTILATCCTDSKRQRVYQEAGCRLWVMEEKDGRVDLRKLMERMGQEQIDRVLLEGGGVFNWAALKAGVVDKVQAYLAPKLLGGREAKTPVEGDGIAALAQAISLKNSTVIQLGEDFLIESEVKPNVYRDC